MTVLPARTIDELLSHHDLSFVACAYLTLLGREVDPQGEAYYVGRLRDGVHKLTVLDQLCRSPEARKAGVNMPPGLDRAIKQHRWATHPLIGPWVRLFSGAQGNSATERQLRALENSMARLHNQQASVADAVRHLAERPVVLASDTPRARAIKRAAPRPLPDFSASLAVEHLDSHERRLLGLLHRHAGNRPGAA